MEEFSNRIDAQRHILQIVNMAMQNKEQLLGLSNKAISRWCTKNEVNTDSDLVVEITKASEKLFFLANKSQEQITNEYKEISSEISNITINISHLVRKKV